MAPRQKVYFPPRLALSGTVSGNLIQQLEFSDHTEELDLIAYNKRRVSGWTVNKENGENILIIGKKTTAKFDGSILLIPDVSTTTIQSSINKPVDGQKWLSHKPLEIGLDNNLTKICTEVHSSWINSFNFVKEQSSNGNIERFGLRSPQLGALYACLAHWTVSDEIGTVVMPTGTGKTEAMLALLAHERFKRLLVIVPTDALREQIFKKFLTFGILQEFGILNKDAKLPVVGKIKHCFKTVDEANLFMESCNIAVATMAVISSCNSEIQKTVAINSSHIFFDEAHHIVAQTWNYFRELARDYKKPILQFTATPFRRDGKHIGGKSIFTYPLRKAQEEGYFKPINFISIWEFNLEIADRAIAIKAVRILEEDINNSFDHLLMARTNTIKRAKEVYNIYTDIASEYNPLIIHSQLNQTEKAQALKKLNTRKSRIVICVDMLGEGFDLPQLKIAALHDIHKSLAVTIQFTGRFTRTTSGIGEATIVANAADANVEEALEDLAG
jgi:superfamily II DNA or RNA helicase